MLALLAMGEGFKVVYHGQIYDMLYTPERTCEDVLRTLQTKLYGIYRSAMEMIAYTQKQLSCGTVIASPGNEKREDDPNSGGNIIHAIHDTPPGISREANCRYMQLAIGG
ncbi:hypothetical protein VN97_g10962 [Penicillium thymicola]|uniref:Uncharacterized protein n=1 Tax=Penicillium thymicola TaxID=293382 RepID=A0AAI9T9I7_PENTH|nr:hypothetical protein VN97_g10962 [Penicillium thymicola]